MNPEQLPNVPTPESAPRPSGQEKLEHSGGLSPERQTSGLERGAEAKELSSEAQAVASDLASGAAPAIAAPPAIPAPSLPGESAVAKGIQAADEDEIEKEWVDRTKHIIKATKGDPYKREQQIVDVREEYQKKRFDRTRGENQL